MDKDTSERVSKLRERILLNSKLDKSGEDGASDRRHLHIHLVDLSGSVFEGCTLTFTQVAGGPVNE